MLSAAQRDRAFHHGSPGQPLLPSFPMQIDQHWSLSEVYAETVRNVTISLPMPDTEPISRSTSSYRASKSLVLARRRAAACNRSSPVSVVF
jgi:hypothetical protein